MATLAPHNSAQELIVAIEVAIREAVAHAIAPRDPTGGGSRLDRVGGGAGGAGSVWWWVVSGGGDWQI